MSDEEYIPAYNPTKSHWLDENVLAHLIAAYPSHKIGVTNRWGHRVCGFVPYDRIGRIEAIERKERDWEYFVEQSNG